MIAPKKPEPRMRRARRTSAEVRFLSASFEAVRLEAIGASRPVRRFVVLRAFLHEPTPLYRNMQHPHPDVLRCATVGCTLQPDPIARALRS